MPDESSKQKPSGEQSRPVPQQQPKHPLTPKVIKHDGDKDGAVYRGIDHEDGCR